MAGVYSADSGFNVTVVGENDLPMGLYANGSFRVTTDAGPGLYAPNGAWRIVNSTDYTTHSPSGALNGVLEGSVFYPAGLGGERPPSGFGFLILNRSALTLNNKHLMMEHADA